jgi:hypothetical protein
VRQQPQAPPFMGYHRDFDQQWEEQNQNQRYEPRHEQKWEGSVKIDVPEFSGGLDPNDFTDWLNHVERVFEYHDIPNHMKVKIVSIKLTGRASVWWKQIRIQRTQLEKTKVKTWTKMKQKLQRQFLSFNYLQTLSKNSHNLRQTSSIAKPIESFYQLTAKEDLYESEEFQIKWVQSNPLPPRTAPTFTKSWSQPPKKGDARSNVASTRTVANKATKTLFKNQGGVVFKCFKYGEAGHRAVGCKKGFDVGNNDEQEKEQPLVLNTEVEEEEQPLVYDVEVEEEIEGDQEVEDMAFILDKTLLAPKEGMFTNKPMSN